MDVESIRDKKVPSKKHQVVIFTYFTKRNDSFENALSKVKTHSKVFQISRGNYREV